MKKVKSFIESFFVAVFSLFLCAILCLGCAACSTDTTKQNTSAAMEYSKDLATSILQSAFSDLKTKSYTISVNQKAYIGGALISSEGNSADVTFINTNDKTEIYQTFFIGPENNINVDEVIKKLTDITTSTTKYYYIDTVTTSIEGNETLKYYREVDTDNFSDTITANLDIALSYVTGGRLYNGISYINCYFSFDEPIYSQIQIKDGSIIKIDSSTRTGTYMELKNTMSITYNYNNIKAKDLPDTVQDLQALGYVEGDYHSLL